MTPRFSVADFVAVTNQTLDTAFGLVEVEGEVAEFKVNQYKYVFFTLKDDLASIGCFMMVWQMRTPIEDGMRVVVRATPKLTAWGRFSLTVQSVELVGEGSIKKSLALLRSKLDKEGLFDSARKRPLPPFPERIAVISSVQAAGYADFMKIAEQRWDGGRFLVAHVAVQGAGAADQIIRAVEHFNQMSDLPDVIVILRGGGSADDLAAFNDELLVRAVAASRVPVLTGIGHEVDESLVDLAADARASTPSNAAELLMPSRLQVRSDVRTAVVSAMGVMERILDEAASKISLAQRSALDAWSRTIDEQRTKVEATRRLLAEYDPEVVLKRGYALIDGVHAVDSVVKITTKDAYMKARIEAYEKR